MAFRCGPARWASFIPDRTGDEDDGTIFVVTVHGNGRMEGRHRRPDANPGDPDEDLQNGQCIAGTETIEFDREGFHYFGKIFERDGGLLVYGTRSSTRNFKDREDQGDDKFRDDEVWVGVKTGT